MEYKKAVTLSFDDGVVYDKRMIELLDKYKIKCTFNINANLQRAEQFWEEPSKNLKIYRLPLDELADLYKGHEVAAHSYTHADLCSLTDEELFFELSEDVHAIEEKFGYKIEGFAYPCGNYDQRTIEILKNLGIKYARTTKSTCSTAPQTNLIEFNPSWHIPYHMRAPEHKENFYNALNAFLNAKPSQPMILYLWGHSYEFELNNSWGEFEEFLDKISGKSDILYGTNREVFSYFKEYKY